MGFLPSFLSSAPSVRLLSPADGPLAVRFLERDPGANAFLLGWIHHYGVFPANPGWSFEFRGVYREGRLRAILLLAAGSLVVLASDDEAAARMLADEGVRRGWCVESVLARLPDALAFWERLAAAGFEERQIFPQQLLEATRASLRPFSCEGLRRASPADLQDVWDASVRMHREETSMEPSARDREDIWRAVAHKIDQERVWVLRDERSQALLFKASIAAAAPAVAQVEGVWVPPPWRGRHIARDAMGQLGHELLDRHERLSLYTATTNAPALALYARLGYRPAGSWCTIFCGRRAPS